MRSLLNSNLPIVGQGVRVIGYTILPLVMCDCGYLAPLQLVAQVGSGQIAATALACPQCQTTYQILSLDMDAQKRVLFNLDQKKPLAVA